MSRTPGSRNTHWTPLMDEYLLKKRMKGETFDEIASALGVSGKSVRNRFHRRFSGMAGGIFIPRRRVHSIEVRDTVLSMRRSGVPIKVVAIQCGLTVNQVNGIWNHWRDYQPRRTAA